MLLPRARKKPRNYRERLSYVNLETANLAVFTNHFPNSNHLNFLPSG